MYTSTYSSSPRRLSTTALPTENYEYQSYHQEVYRSSNNINNSDINKMNDHNMNLRRGPGDYPSTIAHLVSTPLRAPSSPRSYSNERIYSPNDSHAYRSPDHSSPYRPYGNDNEPYRSNATRYDTTGASRAHSYDDLYHDQQRYQTTPSYPRNNTPYRPVQPAKGNQYDDYDDDLVVKSTDLPANHEQEMIRMVREAFRKYDIRNQRELAGYLKRTADKTFLPCWHCIVGRQFSSYVTHEMNGFIYFTKGPLSILLFKSGA